MLENSLRTRGVIFAYLLVPPVPLDRERAYGIHGAICDELARDDLSLRFDAIDGDPGDEAGHVLRFEAKEERGGFQFELLTEGGEQPTKLSLEYAWPRSLPHVSETFDIAARAVFEAVGEQHQPVLAEVRTRKDCDAPGREAAAYVRDRLVAPGEWVDTFGEGVGFASVRLVAPPGEPDGDDPLAAPRRDLTVEVLKEEPAKLYLEAVSQWPPHPGQARPIDRSPSTYVADADDFVLGRVAALPREG